MINYLIADTLFNIPVFNIINISKKLRSLQVTFLLLAMCTDLMHMPRLAIAVATWLCIQHHGYADMTPVLFITGQFNICRPVACGQRQGLSGLCMCVCVWCVSAGPTIGGFLLDPRAYLGQLQCALNTHSRFGGCLPPFKVASLAAS